MQVPRTTVAVRVDAVALELRDVDPTRRALKRTPRSRRRRSRLLLRRTPREPRVASAAAAGDAPAEAAATTARALVEALRELKVTATRAPLSRPPLVVSPSAVAEVAREAVVKAAEVVVKAAVAVVTVAIVATVATVVPRARATSSLEAADVAEVAATDSRRTTTERTALMQIKVSWNDEGHISATGRVTSKRPTKNRINPMPPHMT